MVLACGVVILPLVTPHSFDTLYPDRISEAPSGEFWFGTDDIGRDMFIRVILATRLSLLVALFSTLVTVIIGVCWGVSAAYLGGTVDEFMMRFVDVLYSLPFIFFAIILMVVFGQSLLLVFLAIGAVQWLTMARIIRGQTLVVKNHEFVEAARAIGLPARVIIFRHIAPNLLGYIVVYAALTVPEVILLESFLSFVGLGVPEPSASLGSLISAGLNYVESYPWMLLFPGTFLFLVIFCLNFFWRRSA